MVDIDVGQFSFVFFVFFQNEKRAGWVNVGELEGCVHFKIGKFFLHS
jgi:hypothetical protein